MTNEILRGSKSVSSTSLCSKYLPFVKSNDGSSTYKKTILKEYNRIAIGEIKDMRL